MELAGCIVLYNPPDIVLENIRSCIEELEILYVIDNSEIQNQWLVKVLLTYPKCKYIPLGFNRGIAYALNSAARMAMHDGFRWLLTLDQDSCINKKAIADIKHYIEFERDKDVKIISIIYHDKRKKYISTKRIQYIKQAITSGSTIDLRAWKRLGGFCEKLFIDEVDTEYCYRVILSGYKIVRLNTVEFKHSVGNQICSNGTITFNYPAVRYYYIIRNQLYIYLYYKKSKNLKYRLIEDVIEHKPESISIWLKSIYYENHKFKKYIYSFLGVWDCLTNHMGKCRWEVLS